ARIVMECVGQSNEIGDSDGFDDLRVGEDRRHRRQDGSAVGALGGIDTSEVCRVQHTEDGRNYVGAVPVTPEMFGKKGQKAATPGDEFRRMLKSRCTDVVVHREHAALPKMVAAPLHRCMYIHHVVQRIVPIDQIEIGAEVSSKRVRMMKYDLVRK